MWNHLSIFCVLLQFCHGFDHEPLYSYGYDGQYENYEEVIPGHAHHNHQPPVVKRQPITTPAAKSLQDFACDLINSMSADGLPGNMAVSPLSLYTALAMLRPGLDGESLVQVNRAMRTDDLDEEELCEMYNRVFKPNKKLKLRYANRVYADRSVKLRRAYRNDIKSLNTTQVRRMDFTGNSEKSRQKINRFVRKKTRDLIPEILPQGAVDDSTRMILVNALYMKAPWQVQFEEHNTKPRKFWVNDRTAIRVPTMFHRMYYCTTHNDDVTNTDVTVLTLEEGVSMILLLPRNTGNFSSIYDNDRGSMGEKFDNIVHSIWREENNGKREMQFCAITLPKFTTEYSMDNPISVLQRLGVSDIFDRSRADLSRLTHSRGLYVNDVRHKTTFKTSEQGIEAAAATSVGVFIRSAVGNFRQINKPFMYFVRHDSTGALLFAGKVVDPTAT